MNTATAIRRAIPVLAEHGSSDDIANIWLIRAGLSRKQAHDARRFIPLAFGREILGGMGVSLPDTYYRVTGGGNEERPLANEPFFQESMQSAQALGRELGGETFTTIATQSAELQALNQALNAGASPDGLVAGSPFIEWDAALDNEVEAEPWWKVW
jgi:hypothetical protein